MPDNWLEIRIDTPVVSGGDVVKGIVNAIVEEFLSQGIKIMINIKGKEKTTHHSKHTSHDKTLCWFQPLFFSINTKSDL